MARNLHSLQRPKHIRNLFGGNDHKRLEVTFDDLLCRDEGKPSDYYPALTRSVLPSVFMQVFPLHVRIIPYAHTSRLLPTILEHAGVRWFHDEKKIPFNFLCLPIVFYFMQRLPHQWKLRKWSLKFSFSTANQIIAGIKSQKMAAHNHGQKKLG